MRGRDGGPTSAKGGRGSAKERGLGAPVPAVGVRRAEREGNLRHEYAEEDEEEHREAVGGVPATWHQGK